MRGMGAMWVLAAGVFGGGAGYGARVLLAGLRAPVPVRPGVCEAVGALGWAAVAWRATTGGLPAWWLPVPAALVWLTLVLTASDLRHQLLPDRVTLPAGPVLAALLTVAAAAGPGPRLALRAAVAGLLLLAAHALVHLTAPGQLGAGDVKLAGPVGAVLGAVSWSAVLMGVVLAAVVTTTIAGVTRRGHAPHGPGLLLATLFIALFPAGMAT